MDADKKLQSAKFLSTPSARRATLYHNRVFQQFNISIHALREEGDIHSLAFLS